MKTQILIALVLVGGVAPYAVADHTGQPLLDDILHDHDQDDDGIFDEVEQQLCGAPFIRNQVDGIGPMVGVSCADIDDLDYGERTATITIPGGLFVGGDDDDDSVPRNVTVQFFDVTIDASGREVERVRNATADNDTIVDMDDANPNVPAQRVFRATLPGDFALGDDLDGDSFADFVLVEHFDFEIDTTTGDVQDDRNLTADVEIDVDADDADPNVPIQRIFAATVPTGAAPGADLDGDGIPATVVLQRSDLLLDTIAGTHALTRNATADTTEVLDPDDDDPNVPAQRIFILEAPSGVLLGDDLDGDGLPATATVEVNETTIDTRDGSIVSDRKPASDVANDVDVDDADPNAPVQRIFSFLHPAGLVPGDDLDGDGFPATATLQFNNTTVDTRDGSVDSVHEPSEDVTEIVDSDDGNPNAPVVRVLTQIATCGVTPAPDGDGDDLPPSVTIESCTYTIDTRTGDADTDANDAGDETVPLDANDADVNVPIVRRLTQTGPCDLTPSGDADGDNIPANVIVEGCEFTADTTTDSAGVASDDENSADQTVVLDAADTNENVPIQRVFEQTALCGAEASEDIDLDNLPDFLLLQACDFFVDTRDGTNDSPRNEAEDTTLDLDPDDGDENVPVQRIYETVVPTDADPGADPDDDGFPSDVTIAFNRITVDTRDGSHDETAAPSETESVDPQPGNADAPLVTCGTGAPTVPSGVPTHQLVDADNDGLLGSVRVNAASQRIRICGDGAQPLPPSAPGTVFMVPGPDGADTDPCNPVSCPLRIGTTDLGNRYVGTLRALDGAFNALDGWSSMRTQNNPGLCEPILPPCFRFEATLWDMNCEPVDFASVKYRYRHISGSLAPTTIGPFPNSGGNVLQFNTPATVFSGAGSTNLVVAFEATYEPEGGGADIASVIDYVASRLAPLPGTTGAADLPCRVGDAFDRANLGTPFLVQFTST